MFTTRTKLRLARSLITKDQPIYVQYYVTARCNLACEQCNIIYANADVPEGTTQQAVAIARNLGKIGVSVVLLTGGEPFARKDLPQIVKALSDAGIHVRIQTNGLASREALAACVESGANDISISLDSLEPGTQDAINGGFENSWTRAIRTICWVNELFPADAFAAFGCVIAPRNFAHVPDVIRFATEIGWWVSLVPAHTAPAESPMGFRTYDPALRFTPALLERVAPVLDQVEKMRDEGYNLYDSDAYLADMRRFIKGQPVQWRDRNAGVCDSPNLYFAIRPDGNMAVCCDWRMRSTVPVYAPDFPERYHDRTLRQEVHEIASACPGCLFGSFPEITISARYLTTMVKRIMLFNAPSRKRQLIRMPESEMFARAEAIRSRSPHLYGRRPMMRSSEHLVAPESVT
jgi:MoaA/NifB/PqqE/SkfB family radical SAM enzyme